MERNQGKTAAIRHALAQATGDILIIKTPTWNTTQPKFRT